MKRILVIEDDQKHIKDAEVTIANNPEVSADFAKTFNEATKLMKENEYDGIISDIFFPCHNEKECSSSITGWNKIISSKCYALLISFGIGFGGYEEYIQAAYRWLKGKSMHPTGVIVAKMAIESELPIILVTDTYHHGYKTEPVNQWARKNRITLIDSEPDDRYNGSDSQKNWESAIEILLTKIHYAKQKQE